MTGVVVTLLIGLILFSDEKSWIGWVLLIAIMSFGGGEKVVDFFNGTQPEDVEIGMVHVIIHVIDESDEYWEFPISDLEANEEYIKMIMIKEPVLVTFGNQTFKNLKVEGYKVIKSEYGVDEFNDSDNKDDSNNW